MLDKKTEESRQNYNKKASTYEDTFEGRFTLPFCHIISDIAPLHDGDTILDVACGNGRLLSMLSKKAKVDAYGIDISEEMISVAAREQESMRFFNCPADHTPFEEQQFDLITVCCAFHHFTHPEAFLAEAFRILKTGGTLLVAEPYLPAVLRQIENAVLPLLKMGDVRTYSKKELVAYFSHAGLKEVVIELRDRSKLFITGTKI